MKAANATAQWQEHLREEEEERRLRYDQQRAKEHEVVLAALEKARRRIDAATSKAGVTAAKAAVDASLPALQKKVVAIDPKRQSSNLLSDYEAILAALAGPYPTARLASLAGDDKSLAELRSDIERRFAKARAWLVKEGEEERKRRKGKESEEEREREREQGERSGH